jgi:hypothetical protein
MWKRIPGYSNYEASSDGDIRRAVDGPKNHWARKGRVRLRSVGLKGKVKLRLWSDEEQRFKSVHAANMILLAFVGPKPTPEHHACHRDDDKLNDKLSNLYWGTAKENKADARHNGRIAQGARHGAAKLTATEVRKIRVAKGTLAVLAERYNVGISAIWAIKARRTWKSLDD